jgi:hypothetical protein
MIRHRAVTDRQSSAEGPADTAYTNNRNPHLSFLLPQIFSPAPEPDVDPAAHPVASEETF